MPVIAFVDFVMLLTYICLILRFQEICVKACLLFMLGYFVSPVVRFISNLNADSLFLPFFSKLMRTTCNWEH